MEVDGISSLARLGLQRDAQALGIVRIGERRLAAGVCRETVEDAELTMIVDEIRLRREPLRRLVAE